ncbi:IS21 family transposase [Paraliobacillus ryukyuensis]|uniref:IS21 family transposase n=1 Tax=Paraliobacillus ryukyuensis TaxID=200904 RepID=UPI0009A67E2A|nr:IS21 family transposase [Paraliobacillus ryukyuensis]
MLAMPEVNYIKHLRENEDLSINEISRKTGCNWRTVKKYADGEVSQESLSSSKKGMMYDEGYGEIVDYWLEEDMKLKRKDRRTNKNMFEQLKREHGFKGSYRTVCDYIQYRKPQMKEEKTTRYERLDHPPGEAQVDFGNMTVVKDGAYKDIKALILSFPHSNAGFAYPLPAENSECFLEGLKQLFYQAGGVPTYLRIDNLAAAVISIGKGEKRTYTDSFLRFQAHYNFEVQPCNPASGHEKGNVEKKVDYTRNNLFTTHPIMEDFPQLTNWLQEEMTKDRNRPHYEKGVLIEELWEEDKNQLKALPVSNLPIYSIDSLKVNKYGEIEVDGEKFVIHKARIKQVLILKKEWNQFSCITNDGEVIYQEFRAYMNKTRAIPWDDILNDWEKKPRAVKYSRFYKYLSEKIQVYLIMKPEEIKKRVKGLRKLLEKYALDEIDEVLGAEGRIEREPHELGYILEAKAATYPEKIREAHTPGVLLDYEIDLNTYDKKLCPSLEGGIS